MTYPDTIRSNIARFERLLKVESPDYSHETVRQLLAEAQAQLRLAEAEVDARKVKP